MFENLFLGSGKTKRKKTTFIKGVGTEIFHEETNENRTNFVASFKKCNFANPSVDAKCNE